MTDLWPYLGAGHGIYSVRPAKLFTIVADTMGGGHDMLSSRAATSSVKPATPERVWRAIPGGARRGKNSYGRNLFDL